MGVDAHCAWRGRLRLAVEVPGASGGPRWLHVELRDRAGEFPPRTTVHELSAEGRGAVELDAVPDGRYELRLVASASPIPHRACRGDVEESLRLEVAGGFLGFEQVARHAGAPLLLVRRATNPCPGERAR
jgi:hypothetical protein